MQNNPNKTSVVLSACFILLFCGLFLIFFIWEMVTHDFDNLDDWLLILLLGPCLFAIAWTELLVETRKCEITKTGIRVKYLLSRERLLSWEQFQEICICFEPVKKRSIPPRFSNQEIVCFALHTARKNIWRFWDIYSKRYFRSILFVRYSEEIRKQLQENCPKEILDFRQDTIYQNRY